MNIDLISEEEKKFVFLFNTRIKELQKKQENAEDIVYTKISISYALTNSLCFLNILFHPKCLSSRKYFDVPRQDNVKETIEQIIIHETTTQQTYLTSSELNTLIQHFRELEKKVSKKKTKKTLDSSVSKTLEVKQV